MNTSPSLLKTYTFIRKKRFDRKSKLYKTALSILVDKTTAIYLLVLLGYMVASLFIFGDFVADYNDWFIALEGSLPGYRGLIMTGIPFLAIMQSFSRPGIIYSTSEHQLSFLPFSRKGIWFLAALEKGLKSLGCYLVVGLLIILLTPLSVGIVVQFIGIILLMEILMIIPQWMLFQEKLLIKISWLILGVIISVSYTFIDVSWKNLSFIGVLIIINLYLSKRIFKRVNWSQVTEMNDFQIWDMPIISRASGVKVKREKKYSFFQNLKLRKKPFIYSERAIHARLWSLYLAKYIMTIIQLLGAIVLLLFVLMQATPTLFQIGFAFSLHAYTMMLASFYTGRFEADVLNVLPWDLPCYKETFFKWANYGIVIIFIPLVVMSLKDLTIWSPFQLLFFVTVYYFLYHVKINKAMIGLAKQPHNLDLMEVTGYLLLVCVVLSKMYPVLSLLFIGVICLANRQRNYQLIELAN